MPSSEVRPAAAGELCTCGRPAVTVHETPAFGAVGDCGRPGAVPVDGWCVFCRNASRHPRSMVRDEPDGSVTFYEQPQAARCPEYHVSGRSH